MRLTWPLLLSTAAAVTGCPETKVVDGFPPSFVGVGMELRIYNDQPVIVRTLAGGSAAEAGVKARDRLLAIDGRATKGTSLGDIVMQIRGEPGTQVTLTLERAGRQHIIVVRRRQMTKAGKHYAPKSPEEPPDTVDEPPGPADDSDASQDSVSATAPTPTGAPTPQPTRRQNKKRRPRRR